MSNDLRIEQFSSHNLSRKKIFQVGRFFILNEEIPTFAMLCTSLFGQSLNNTGFKSAGSRILLYNVLLGQVYRF
jgi:hypothetical protein